MFQSQFQSFADPEATDRAGARLGSLRDELQRMGVDGFIVPRSDEQQNEYVPASAERLAWLTGFTGSAGLAIVLANEAALFIDGRYTIQARDQADTEAFTLVSIETTATDTWLEAHLPAGARLGYDPWLHTPAAVARFARSVKAADATLVPLHANPIDAVWTDRPAPPRGRIVLHDERFAGESAKDKIIRVQTAIEKARCDALVVSDAHAVAWLFNIRGCDVAHTPLPLAFAIVPRAARARLFIEPEKVPNEVRDALQGDVDFLERSMLAAEIERLGAAKARVRFDASTAPSRLVDLLQADGGDADVGLDPIALMKATKNTTELAGARAAHLRDAVAMAQFLAWFHEEAREGEPTEIDAAQALETFRRETGELVEIAFPTIAAAGPNAASPHYRVTRSSNRRIRKGIFLIDSGAQYHDGTTDVTRTLAIGKPSHEMRDRFTRVLKGHIAIARAVFPKGTTGGQIDALARAALWDAGLDFDHGTGHGVGSYLSVHEGPQRISKTGGGSALEAGMIISNEPGYYKAGEWGIRIENLVAVEKRAIEGAEREMLGFETLTLTPIDLRLVDEELLTAAETTWLDGYHARVRATLMPLIKDDATRAWLKKATKKLS